MHPNLHFMAVWHYLVQMVGETTVFNPRLLNIESEVFDPTPLKEGSSLKCGFVQIRRKGTTFDKEIFNKFVEAEIPYKIMYDT